MSTRNKRFMLTVPDNIEADVAEVKRSLFYDKSYAEMYRYLIRMGLDSLKAEKAAKENKRQMITEISVNTMESSTSGSTYK